MKFKIFNIILLLFCFSSYGQKNNESNSIDLCLSDIKYVVFTNVDEMIKPQEYKEVFVPNIKQLSEVLELIRQKQKTKNDVFQILFYINIEGNKKVWVNQLIFSRKAKAKKEFFGWENNIIVGMGGFYEKYIKTHIISLKNNY